MNRMTIERSALRLLRDNEVFGPPVPVDEIARGLDLSVEPSELGEGISGVLVTENGLGSIGYNIDHPPVRQRFTVAHEIGHFVLHKEEDLFIDKEYKVIYRDEESASGNQHREREANAFAAALLMPEQMVKEEIAHYGFDLADESSLDKLAEVFQVSRQAMAYRLANLGIFPGTDHL